MTYIKWKKNQLGDWDGWVDESDDPTAPASRVRFIAARDRCGCWALLHVFHPGDELWDPHCPVEVLARHRPTACDAKALVAGWLFAVLTKNVWGAVRGHAG